MLVFCRPVSAVIINSSRIQQNICYGVAAVNSRFLEAFIKSVSTAVRYHFVIRLHIH